jgi:DNA-binding Xre family transcriptional regulator
MTNGQKIREASLDGRTGVVHAVHATTLTVDWDDGSRSRVGTNSVQPVGRLLKNKDRIELSGVKFKSISRRFQDVVTQRMRELGLTYEDLEEKSGIARRQLMRLAERDDPETRGFAADSIERLARALDVAPGDFWELR